MLRKLALAITLLSSIITSSSQAATVKSSAHKPIQASFVFDINKRKVLHAENVKKAIFPASLTKLMSIYLAFEMMHSGKISADDVITVSNHAANAQPCKLGLAAGDKITFAKAVEAAIVKSANDATRALSEKIAGSELNFALLMNKKAKQLGMRNTHFRNSTGLPDAMQKTTVEDLAKLGLAIKQHFPQYYHLFSKTNFTYNGKVYSGHNRVTKNYPGAEGLKTGYIAASGFNLITTATRQNQSLIGIVIGGKTQNERDKKMVALLDKHFADRNKKNKGLNVKTSSKQSTKTNT